ncbi:MULTISPECIES: hypothetical protein [Natrialbaceae]|uniref:hypothetical protein n=1 Tax=Natrialbaceae TaxID=1644061 RepID=UPI00207D1ABC|nr:hypothetical protein [Natronococcus sp. CG52]
MVPDDRSDRPPIRTASRRRLLASGGVGLAAALAGCGDLRTRTLAHSETIEEDGETHLVFGGDERIAEVSFLDRWNTDGGRPPYGMRLHAWHAEDTHLERLRYELRPIDVERPPEFSLTRPGGGPWEPIEFASGDDHETTILNAPELGTIGRGSVGFDLLVEPWNDDAFDLRVDVEATIESGGVLGRTYEIEGHLVRALPGYEQFE